MKKEVTAIAKPEFSLIDENMLKSRIYTIRGLKVMLDADLAEIYGYSTKRFNEQVKCNIERFDEDFRFQLTREEYQSILRSEKTTLEQENLKSEIPTSSWGGVRKLPYAFTEQGIYMLMTVLRGDLAILQSKAIIRLFKQMKDYIIAENRNLLGYDGIAQIAMQTERNTKDIAVIQSDLQKVMENFVDPSTFKHFLILNGRRLDADVAYTQIYGMAKKSITIIDDYVGVKTLDLLRGIIIRQFSVMILYGFFNSFMRRMFSAVPLLFPFQIMRAVSQSCAIWMSFTYWNALPVRPLAASAEEHTFAPVTKLFRGVSPLQ